MNSEQNKTLMPFGQYKNKPPVEVPSGYLRWYLGAYKLGSGFRAALAAELQARGITPPSLPPLPLEPRCGRCGNEELRYTWHQFRDGRKQIRRECVRCDNWCGYAPLTPENIAKANANASEAPLLDALTQLDELGIELVSDGQAVHFAGDGERRCPPGLRDTIRQCNHTLAQMLLRGRTT